MLKDGKVFPFTVILDDAISNCFIYTADPEVADPQIDIVFYERTQQQNDDLGITDMRV